RRRTRRFRSASGGAPRSSGGEFALTVGRPPGSGEFQTDDVTARLQLFERTAIAGAADAPRAVRLRVVVGVEGRAADRGLALRLDDRVFERPDAGRGGGTRQVDLRVVHPVARVERLGAHRAAQEGDDRVASVEAVRAAGIRGLRVFGEAFADLVPQLLVEAA